MNKIKLRDSLCKKCREKIRNYEKEYYKKNQDKKKKYRRGYYLGKEKPSINKDKLKEIVNNLPD